MCRDIDECLTNSTGCDENSSCMNTDGSFSCTCNKSFFGNGKICLEGQCDDGICPENKKCVSSNTVDCECKDGFITEEDDTCTDVNECLGSADCNTNAVCINTPGSFDCACEDGFLGNGSYCGCYEGFQLNENEKCTDIDECQISENCHAKAQCKNTVGSYKCTCPKGFFGNGKVCTRDSLLILNSGPRKQGGQPTWKPAAWINITGSLEKLPSDCVERDQGTEAWKSCSVQWQNKMHIYGGHKYQRQITRLDGFQLRKIGDLTFDFIFGACSTINGQFIYLCFDLKSGKQCRRSLEPSFSEFDSSVSNNRHRATQISSSESELNILEYFNNSFELYCLYVVLRLIVGCW